VNTFTPEGKYTAFDMWFAFADDWPDRQDLAPGRWVVPRDGLALSGSNQARKGRLVDALAVRGDEGRDTLR